MEKTYSQNGQDLFIKKVFQNKKDGYFLEIGGGDGLWISNTLLLEEDFGWTGILVEPTSAYKKLVKNRPNCVCINKCVSDKFETLTLIEIHDKGQSQIDSKQASENLLLTQVTKKSVNNIDAFNSKWGEVQKAYEIDAVPLESILDEANAPKYIDYFSLDVEGHEETILLNFPFEKYSFGCLGIEAPSVALNEKLHLIGYKKVKQIGGDAMYLNTSKFNIIR